ncbi:MAG: hypothetical protein KKH12_08800 [Gammaproteobacteria bacterium]|nr:hypothetical protein [Gammaproteobacteria bacterium]MBU1481763.1 hypothetical protein [Gammaproteobacteria bacterium]
MNERQCDDPYIPTFLLAFATRAETKGRGEEEVEDFLKNVQGWSECIPPDENDEWI